MKKLKLLLLPLLVFFTSTSIQAGPVYDAIKSRLEKAAECHINRFASGYPDLVYVSSVSITKTKEEDGKIKAYGKIIHKLHDNSFSNRMLTSWGKCSRTI